MHSGCASLSAGVASGIAPVQPHPSRPGFDDDVLELLSAYQRVRDGVARQGAIVTLEHGGRRRLRGLRRFVLYGLDDHVARRATQLRRRVHADSLSDGAEHPAALSALDHTLAALPPVPYRRLYAALVLLVAAASLGVIGLLRNLDSARSLRKTLGAANDLVDNLATRVLTIDVGQLPDALKDLGKAGDPRVFAFVAIIIALALYAILRPFTSTFRIRRELVGGELAAREAHVLGSVPREMPFDLLVYALPMLLPLYVGLYMVGDGLARGDSASIVAGAVLLVAPASARLAYLWIAWRRRVEETEGARAPVRARFAVAEPAEPGSNPVRART
jgi:hypothetical protein